MRVVERAALVVAGLGGAENIVRVEADHTRLSAQLRDLDALDHESLRAAGVHGHTCGRRHLQLLVAPRPDALVHAVNELLCSSPAHGRGRSDRTSRRGSVASR